MVDKWNVRYVVWTGERDRTPRQILEKVSNRFGIIIPEDKVEFVFLRLRFLIEASTWPRFTLAGQMFGSVLLGIEALIFCRPHVFFDTMGYAFTYPMFKWLLGCRVVSYVHYPIVSVDMLALVTSRQASYNNRAGIGRSKVLTSIKVGYYRILALLYGFVGRRSDVIMVNSSWTYGHIKDIWNCDNINIVYPPCDCKMFLKVPSNRSEEECRIVSVGQFRPEKDHKKQIDVVKAVLRKKPNIKKFKLMMVGSCRDEGDQKRVASLKDYASDIGVLDNVEFLVNTPFSTLQKELSRSLIAVHTMWNEHFGISLVECMSSGCIMIAHRSGGPQMDIMTDFNGQQTGFLAETVEEFADSIIEVLRMSPEEREVVVRSAKESVCKRFSVETFQNRLIHQIQPIMG